MDWITPSYFVSSDPWVLNTIIADCSRIHVTDLAYENLFDDFSKLNFSKEPITTLGYLNNDFGNQVTICSFPAYSLIESRENIDTVLPHLLDLGLNRWFEPFLV